MISADLNCFREDLYIQIEDDYISIYRCCYFSVWPENQIKISISELPENDNELKCKILDLALTKPQSFRDLTYGSEKHCLTSCTESYHNPSKIFFRIKGCNLNCVMCGIDKSFPSQKALDIYKRLMYIFKDDFIIFTTSSGEPFLYKKIIFDVLQNGCKSITSISNLTLLNDQDIEFLKQFQNKYLIISSIDSITEDVYLSMRKPANSNMFHKVISNFEKLAKYNLLKENNVTITKWNLNFEDLENTLLWADKFGVPTKFGTEYGNEELLKNPIVLALKEKYPNSWRI